MRVAFVSELTTHHRETGATRRTRRTAERLAERGHDVVVCCAQWWGGDHDYFEQNDVLYRAVTAESPDTHTDAATDTATATGVDGEPSPRFALSLPRLLADVNPDVIQAAPAPTHVLAAKAASVFLRVPLVVDWYESPRGPWGNDDRLLELAATAPELVITPSRTVKTRVRELGADDDAVRVVPNSIDMDAIRAADTRHVTDIVYSRRLDEDANLESLLLALAELRDRDWSAAVIGDGPERANYERQVRDLRIEDRVQFVGDQSLETRLPVFKGAHVYVQTARREAFPTDLLRAMACGCTGVVEYHVDSSAHELVERRDRAFRTTSEQELTEALVAASDMAELDVNEEFAEFDHDAVLEQYLDCYDDAEANRSIAPLVAVGGVAVALVVVALLFLLVV